MVHRRRSNSRDRLSAKRKRLAAKRELFALLAVKKIQPRIAQTLPLLAARTANERLEAGRIEGKIVLVAPEVAV